MTRTWYSTNNTASLEDLPSLEALGITVRPRSRRPIHVFRDLETGRMLAEIGSITVWRDGRVWITPRADCPDGGLVVLTRTALDCAERDLHRRDSWRYHRATRNQAGQWSAVIQVALPENGSVLEAHAAALRPAARPATRVPADADHTRA